MVNRRQLESLVKAGAFDSLDSNRAMLFHGIDVILGQANEAASERRSGQSNLFGGGEPQPLAMHTRLDWKPTERLQQEFEAVGFYLSAHPMEAYARALARLAVVSAANLAGHIKGGGKTHVKMAGVVTGKQERMTSRGTRMAYLTVSDASGQFEVTLFAEVLNASRELIESSAPLLINLEARTEEGGEQLRLTASSIESLDKAAANSTAGLKVWIGDDKPLAMLKELIGGESKGKGRIILVARSGDREVEAHLPGLFALSPSLINAVRATPGVIEVREV
jgi:DNA polymerase-3 subunit alpha